MALNKLLCHIKYGRRHRLITELGSVLIPYNKKVAFSVYGQSKDIRESMGQTETDATYSINFEWFGFTVS